MSPLMNALVVSALIVAVLGQTTHIVSIGVLASVPDPPTVAARLGDTVMFVFGNGLHGVTQSSFESPCLPLPGGFNSGLVPIPNPTAPQSWSLIITDASAPIWYFCQGSNPVSHCTLGMVGVINPYNISSYDSFASAAKAVSGTPTPTPAFTATGVGAHATGPPSPVLAASTTPSASTQTSSTITPSVAATSTKSGSSSNAGIIVGGVIGGFLALALVGLLAWLLRRVGRNTTMIPPPHPFDASPYYGPTGSHRRHASVNSPIYLPTMMERSPSSGSAFVPMPSQRQTILDGMPLVPVGPALRPEAPLADSGARGGDSPDNDFVARQLTEIKEGIGRLHLVSEPASTPSSDTAVNQDDSFGNVRALSKPPPGYTHRSR